MNTTDLTAAIALRTEARKRDSAMAAALEEALAVEAEKKALVISAVEAERMAGLDEALKRAADRRSAEDVAAAAKREVERAKEAKATAAAELAAAEHAVCNEADAILSDEAERVAAKIEAHLAEATRLGELLKLYQPSALHTPINQMRFASGTVRWTLDRVEAIGRDTINTPVNLLPGGTTWMQAPSADYLAKRRAVLIA